MLGRKLKGIRKYWVIVFVFLSIPISVYYLNKKTSFFNQAYYTVFGTKANIVVNLTNSQSSDSYPWNNFAQGGEEKGKMLDSVVQNIRKLEPNYIRMDHIFDFYVVISKNSSGGLVYDWSKLDGEIGSILATGAKPFLSLSYMPTILSGKTEVDLPISWEEWRQVVGSLIEHVSGRKGLAISDVYYEVWNEPDLFGDFKLKGAKNYLTLYYHASLGATGAKDVLPFNFGGPATTALYKSWFTDFFSYAQKNNLRVDFYSWHLYEKGLTRLEDEISNAKSWILEFPRFATVEFIITENGIDSENNSDFDGKISAVHTLATYLTSFQKISKIFLFELKDGPGPSKFWGRWGILTHEKYGQPSEKPRYKAIEFLNSAKGEFYPVYGQGTWVKVMATQKGGRIRIMLVNYDPFGKHIENVPISLVNLPFENFSVRRIEFLGKVEEFQASSLNKNWSTNQIMQPNTSLIIEVSPR